MHKLKVRHLEITPLAPFGIEVHSREGWSSETNLSDLMRDFRHSPLILIRDFPTLDSSKLISFCAKSPKKELLQWDFGPLMELKVNEKSPNYLFSCEKVPYHWDGAFHEEPSHLVFNCLTPPDEKAGGKTLFANTSLIWRDASLSIRREWKKIQLTYQTERKAHYGGKITLPMIQRHPQMDATIIRYAEPVDTQLNPVTLHIQGTDSPEDLIHQMHQKLYSPQYCYRHHWRAGDLLIADNHLLLHGREAFKKESPRHLRRLQLL